MRVRTPQFAAFSIELASLRSVGAIYALEGECEREATIDHRRCNDGSRNCDGRHGTKFFDVSGLRRCTDLSTYGVHLYGLGLRGHAKLRIRRCEHDGLRVRVRANHDIQSSALRVPCLLPRALRVELAAILSLIGGLWHAALWSARIRMLVEYDGASSAGRESECGVADPSSLVVQRRVWPGLRFQRATNLFRRTPQGDPSWVEKARAKTGTS